MPRDTLPVLMLSFFCREAKPSHEKDARMSLSMQRPVEAAHWRVTDTPTPASLGVWWRTLASDPDAMAVAYADSFPRSLDAFLDAVRTGVFRDFHLIMRAEEVAGSFWLHDPLEVNEVTIGGWMGGYVMPDYRSAAFATARLLLDTMASRGVRHLFSSVYEGNRRSRLYTRQALKFYRIGSFPDFVMIGGRPASVAIYVKDRADEALAWREACKRYQRNLRLR